MTERMLKHEPPLYRLLAGCIIITALTALASGGSIGNTLAGFLRSGGCDRHLRQARRRYRARRDLLVSAIAGGLPGARVSGVAAGLHLLVELPGCVRAAAVKAAAAERGVSVMDLAAYRLAPTPQDSTLVLGYGNLPDRLVEPAVAELAAAVRTAESG